jgi:hypothetical protein
MPATVNGEQPVATLSGIRSRRHRLLVGGDWADAASDYWEIQLPFGGWAGKSSRRGRVGGRHIFESMTQIRSVAFDVGNGQR